MELHRGGNPIRTMTRQSSQRTAPLWGCVYVCVAGVCLWAYLVDEVPDVSRVGRGRPHGVLGLGVEGPLVHPPDPHGLDGVGFYCVGLLQLAQVVVLGRRRRRRRQRKS